MGKVDQIKNYLNRMDNEIKRYYVTLAMAAEYQTLQWAETSLKPEIIVAGIPIFSVQKEGHAASDEILKYRSIGGIFLAHQKGGNRTFKFDALIYGPSRLILLAALQKLLRLGRQIGYPIGDMTWDGWVKYTPQEVAVRQNSIGGYVDNFADFSKAYVPYHRTYPIITDSKIYTNMYLETLVVREDIRLGINCIEVRCAFREYYPPTNIEKTVVEEGKGEDKTTKVYYETWQDPKETLRLKRNDLFLNMVWAARTTTEYYLTKDLQEKEKGKFFIEGAILAATCLPFFGYMGMV